MAMKYELIKAPSKITREMILRRMPHVTSSGEPIEPEKINWGAVLLAQGMVVEIIAAADIGIKAADVTVAELLGNCPQHVNSVAFIGTPSQIEQVRNALQNKGKV